MKRKRFSNEFKARCGHLVNDELDEIAGTLWIKLNEDTEREADYYVGQF